jgi:hypothetical protein
MNLFVYFVWDKEREISLFQMLVCGVQKNITLFGIPKAGSEAEIFWIDMCKFYRYSRVG